MFTYREFSIRQPVSRYIFCEVWCLEENVCWAKSGVPFKILATILKWRREMNFAALLGRAVLNLSCIPQFRNYNKTNSMASVQARTIPIELPPLVGEVSAKFWAYRLLHGHHNGSLRPYSRFSGPEPLHFLSSSSSIELKRLSGLSFRPTNFQNIL
jgi:hypothetical protein